MARHYSKAQFEPAMSEGSPNHLLNTLLRRLNAKNDLALARKLEIPPSAISKIRHGKLPISANMLVRMHEVSQLSIGDLRDLMGDHRRLFGIDHSGDA